MEWNKLRSPAYLILKHSNRKSAFLIVAVNLNVVGPSVYTYHLKVVCNLYGMPTGNTIQLWDTTRLKLVSYKNAFYDVIFRPSCTLYKFNAWGESYPNSRKSMGKTDFEIIKATLSKILTSFKLQCNKSTSIKIRSILYIYKF